MVQASPTLHVFFFRPKCLDMEAFLQTSFSLEDLVEPGPETEPPADPEEIAKPSAVAEELIVESPASSTSDETFALKHFASLLEPQQPAVLSQEHSGQPTVSPPAVERETLPLPPSEDASLPSRLPTSGPKLVLPPDELIEVSQPAVAPKVPLPPPPPPPRPQPSRATASSSAPQPPTSTTSASSSGLTADQPEKDSSKGGHRATERWRSGINGGKARFGNSGGANKKYYQGFYAAKGLGRAELKAFIEQFGPPPTRGGTAYHERKGRGGGWGSGGQDQPGA